MTDRVAIVYPWSNLDTVPSLCNTAELLAGAGYKVDIFARHESAFIAPSFSHQGIETIATKYRSEQEGIQRFIPAELFYPFRVWRRHRWSRYCCFIGVDPQGLTKAYSIARFLGVPVVYYSLELLLSDELWTPAQKRLKEREIELSRRAAFVITQDDERAQLLAQDNQIPLERFALVPNAPLGPARRRPSFYWHQEFGIPLDRRVVLHAGSLGQWTSVHGIVESVKSWPENWVLVVHTRFDARSSIEVERLCKAAAPGRVFFSRLPVRRQQYEKLIDGADIGVAFYVPTPGDTYTQQNIQAVGLSSGKIAWYLRSGLPIIVNEVASVSKLAMREGCGISIQGASDIGRAISRIAEDCRGYSARASRTFDEYFDFGCSFQEVIRRIGSIAA